MRRISMAVALMVAGSATARADDGPKRIAGRVVSPSGAAVEGASVSAFWGANGMSWDEVEKLSGDDHAKIWKDEGKMAPWGGDRAVTDPDGRFSLAEPGGRSRTLMVYDRDRRNGAVVAFDPARLDRPIEVRLAPTVRVFGTDRLEGADGSLKWTCTYLNLPYDRDDPLKSTRMAICGSFRTMFEFRVPPGTYELSASSDSPGAYTVDNRKVTIEAGQADVDLGPLVLTPRSGGVQDLVDRSKARGTWGNYRDNFGKRPPDWHVTDARGIAKDAKLGDLRGKWVVLYFWGPDCAPCMADDLPKLMAFCDDHKARRDRFEVVAICCDFLDRIHTIEALDAHLADVKRAVWKGRDLPFPLILDDTFQTYERYGLEGSGVSNTLLVDPEGKLVEGDLKSLGKILETPPKP